MSVNPAAENVRLAFAAAKSLVKDMFNTEFSLKDTTPTLSVVGFKVSMNDFTASFA